MQEELIGREPERAQLDAWVTEAMAGHGSLVLLAGEAGVGKTTLAKNTLSRSDLQSLEGFAVQGGTSPFGPIVEGLRSYLRAAGDVPLVEGPLAGHLAMLLPELGPPAPAGDRATLFEAIRQALAAIAARRPTVLFLDDLQWADDATPELLGALARSLDSEPLLVLGAFRSDELPRGHSVRAAAQRAAPSFPAAADRCRAVRCRGQRGTARADTRHGRAVVAPSGVRPNRRRSLLRTRARLGTRRERPPGARPVRPGTAGG